MCVDQGPLTGFAAAELQVCPSLATRPHGIVSKWHAAAPVCHTSWLAGQSVSGCNGAPVADRGGAGTWHFASLPNGSALLPLKRACSGFWILDRFAMAKTSVMGIGGEWQRDACGYMMCVYFWMAIGTAR